MKAEARADAAASIERKKRFAERLSKWPVEWLGKDEQVERP